MLRMRRLLSESWLEILVCAILALIWWDAGRQVVGWLLGFVILVFIWGGTAVLIVMLLIGFLYGLLGPWILWKHIQKEREEDEPFSKTETITWSSLAIVGVIFMAYIYYAYGGFEAMGDLLDLLVKVFLWAREGFSGLGNKL